MPLRKVTDSNKRVTDPVLLSHLVKQGIDWEGVEFCQDYAPRVINGKKVAGRSPYAKFYRDLNSDKRFMVVTGLPKIDADGVKIECGWEQTGNNFTEKNNLFRANVQGTLVEVTVRNDQPDGRKAGNKLSYKPQLFLDGIEQSAGQPVLLPIDPVNLNSLETTLEWDYGICKRRLRIIQGSILGSWVFAANPNGEVRIKYNQIGDYKLRLGRFGINDDEELIPALVFASAKYPFAVSDSETFYPDAHPEFTSVDGHALRSGADLAWVDVRDGVGTWSADGDPTLGIQITAGTGAGTWANFRRSLILLDTSALGAGALKTGAVLSISGDAKHDGLIAAPDINVYASNPASNIALVDADYQAVSGVPFCDTPITYLGWNTAGWNVFDLNGNGINAIDVEGVSKFSLRNANYDVLDTPPPWVQWDSFYFSGLAADSGGATVPKLVVTFTGGYTGDIDMGSTAIDRAGFWTANGCTQIDTNNPANLSGQIDRIEIFVNASMTGVRVGSFYLTGVDTYKCRDSVVIGDVGVGFQKRVFIAPTHFAAFDVEAGDFMGIYCVVGSVEAEVAGADLFWVLGEFIDPGDETVYVNTGPFAISVYELGQSSGGGPIGGNMAAKLIAAGVL